MHIVICIEVTGESNIANEDSTENTHTTHNQ